MSVFDYSYSYFATYLTPVYRRLTNTLALINAWLSPIEWLRRNTWDFRKKGSLGHNYNNSTTYNKKDLVNYGGSTFECIATSLGNLPTNKIYFQLVAENMVGWDERMIYNGRKKTLEFMLYRYFYNYDNTLNFSSVVPNTSSPKSIYIETTPNSSQFVVNTSFGSAVFKTENGGGEAIFTSYTPSSYQATINVPNSTATALGGTTICSNAIKGLVNKYIIAGVTYQINYY